MKLVFATHNQNKFEEVKKIMPKQINLVSLSDIGCRDEIAETGKTLEENARLKADFVTKNYELPCFSDDTGLLVDVLKGAPGIYSARYAGETKNSEDNIEKLLAELEGITERKACFKTVIALNLNGKSHIFEGIVEGEITTEKSGHHGFGYDPIFKPSNQTATFAQLPLKIKNSISHRGRAIQQLLTFLKAHLDG
ncbi:non-canonical purine NTP diphosphatase [Pareuzebyella sediminis]|uniref:non-canonical purine NTP diphosphatase n=1 Tax=Pareuzebyella sediminis TaxID=2607998 RepID=UPI0011F0448F|nr:non-canonical purine NTP diphosphatase [Pareuzebyella sediminis]